MQMLAPKSQRNALDYTWLIDLKEDKHITKVAHSQQDLLDDRNGPEYVCD
jgi:hypothetical protein